MTPEGQQERKKILVTGGAGFIGSHTVVELYLAGYEPIILDNFSNSDRFVLQGIKSIIGKEIKCYDFDCKSYQELEKMFFLEKNILGVIHFAAYKSVSESVANPLKYHENNIGSMVALLHAMGKTGVKNLVFSSSCTVYGQPDTLPVNEETPYKPALSPYGFTKQLCEGIMQDVVASPQPLRAVSLRYFNPIGAHPSAEIGEQPVGVPDNLVPFIVQTAAGIRKKLIIYGNDYNTPDGTCVRDYIHVVDLAKAHVKALQYLTERKEERLYDTFNIGTGHGTGVLEIAQLFEKVSGKKLNYESGKRRAGDAEQVYADASKANKVLGWKSELTVEDALKDAWKRQVQLPVKAL